MQVWREGARTRHRARAHTWLAVWDHQLFVDTTDAEVEWQLHAELAAGLKGALSPKPWVRPVNMMIAILLNIIVNHSIGLKGCPPSAMGGSPNSYAGVLIHAFWHGTPRKYRIWCEASVQY